MVILADIRLLSCLNIISCAYINMHFFNFYFIRNNIFLLLKKVFECDNHPHAGVACHNIWGWLSRAVIGL